MCAETGRSGEGRAGSGARWLGPLLLALPAIAGLAQEGAPLDLLLRRLERNASFQTAFVEGEMTITARKRVATKAFFACLEGVDRAFIEYVSPARDRGLRLLRNADDLRVYLPSARKVMRIKGGARQRRLESDFSFDDVASLTANLRGLYGAELLGAEPLDGRPCLLIRLVARAPGQTFPSRLMWVDEETAVALRTRFFTRSGVLAKELTAAGVRSFGGRFYPTRLVMADRLRRRSETEIVLTRIVFDGPLPPGIFDPGNLAPKDAGRQEPGR